MGNPFGDAEQPQVPQAQQKQPAIPGGNPFGDTGTMPAQEAPERAVKYFEHQALNLGGAVNPDPKLKPKRDKAMKAFTILMGSGSDEDKVNQLRQVFPNIKVNFDKTNGKTITINGKTLTLFEKGTEGYKTLPNISFSDNGEAVPVEKRYQELMYKFAKSKPVQIGGTLVQTLDEKKVKEFQKNFKLSTDSYGNPIVIVAKDTRIPGADSPVNQLGPESLITIPAGKYYMQQPKGIDLSKEGLFEAKDTMQVSPTAVATMMSPIGKAAGILKNSLAVGASAATGETGQQIKNSIQGRDVDLLNIPKEGAYAAGGAFALMKGADLLLRGAKSLFGKGAEKIISKSGEVNQVALDAKLKELGLTHEQAAQQIAKNQKINLTDSQIKELGDWLKSGSVPSAGQLIKGKQGGIERELLSSGDAKTILRSQSQTDAMLSKLDSLQKNPVPTTDAATEVGTAGIKGISTAAKRAKDQVNQKYSAFENNPAAKSNITNKAGVKNTVERGMQDPSFSQHVPLEIKADLKKYGLMGDEQAAEFTIKSASELSKKIGKLARRTADQDKAYVLNRLKNYVESQIEKSSKASGPELNLLRKEAKEEYKRYRAEFKPTGFKQNVEGIGQVKKQSNFAEKILTKERSPETVHNEYIKLPVNQLKRARNTLRKTKEGRDFLEKSNDLLIKDLRDNMAAAVQRNKGVWKSDALENWYSNIGDRAKILLNDEQRAAIETLRKIDPADFGNKPPPVDVRKAINSIFGDKIPNWMMLGKKRGVTFKSSQRSIDRGLKQTIKKGEESKVVSHGLQKSGAVFGQKKFDSGAKSLKKTIENF